MRFLVITPSLYRLICMLFCMTVMFAYGQESSYSTPGAISFRDRVGEVKPGGLISNVVRVVNTTGRSGEFGMRIAPPAGWQVVGLSERTFQMASGDTLFFPIRIIALSQIQRDEPQLINVSLLQFRNVIANDSWMVTPVLRSEWVTSISRNLIVMPSHVDTASITLNIINTGDLAEIINYEIRPGAGLMILDDRGEMIINPEGTFRLAPLQDTLIRFIIGVRDVVETQTERASGPAGQDMRVRLNLSSEPHARTGTGNWRGTIDIKRVSNVWKEKPSRYYSFPLTANFSAYNVLDENAYGDFSLYGFHTINPETNLSYYFQSNFVSNYLNPQAFLGQYLQINFDSRHLGVSLGNVSHSLQGASISGDGIRITGRYEGHSLSATFVQNPGLFSEPRHLQGMAGEYRYASGDLRGNVFLQLRENYFHKTEEEIAGGQVSYRVFGQTVRGGFTASRQTQNWKPDSIFDVTGMGYDLSVSGSYGPVAYSAMYAHSSPTHLVRRGNTSISSRVSWRLNRTNNVFVSHSQVTSDPQLYFLGELRETNSYRKREIYKLGYRYNGTLSDVSFQPLHQRQTDRFLNYNLSGLELDYRINDFHDLRFFSNAIAGYNSFPDYAIDPVFVAHLRAGFRYFQYSFNLRYYFGPYFSTDLLRFVEQGINSNRFGAGLDFDEYILGDIILLRMSVLYNYLTFNQQHSASLRPELFYFPQPDLRLGVYSRFYGIASDMQDVAGLPDIDFEGGSFSSSRFEFGFSLRKDLNVPISNRRFFDLTVVIYRDVSGTGSKQSSDPGLRDMWVRMQLINPDRDSEVFTQETTFEALTDRNGKAIFVNIPPGNYMVTIIPVGQAGSRHESRTYEIMVSSSRTVYLTIDRGARVAGNIILDRDQYTRAEYFPVNAIRVTATDDEGQQFTTLTNEVGQYNLYLPKGRYTVSVNEGIFSDIFDLQQNNVPVEILFEQEIITVNFIARERARQIRIQEPDQNNNNQEQNE